MIFQLKCVRTKWPAKVQQRDGTTCTLQKFKYVHNICILRRRLLLEEKNSLHAACQSHLQTAIELIIRENISYFSYHRPCFSATRTLSHSSGSQQVCVAGSGSGGECEWWWPSWWKYQVLCKVTRSSAAQVKGHTPCWLRVWQVVIAYGRFTQLQHHTIILRSRALALVNAFGIATRTDREIYGEKMERQIYTRTPHFFARRSAFGTHARAASGVGEITLI